MNKKYECPYCHEVEVEEVNACGANNYFCNNCKKLVSSSYIKKQQDEK